MTNNNNNSVYTKQHDRYSLFIRLFVISCLFKLIDASPVLSLSSSNTVKLPPIYWNSKNILFQSINNNANNNNNNNYLSINARLGDNIDLVCPKYENNNQAESNDDNIEYSIIYRVGSKYEFDNCIVNTQNPETVPIFKCDKPFSGPIKYTLYFLKFSPIPFALEFDESQEYYFLSTSNGKKHGINQKVGGLCSKYNMKFSIKIMPDGSVSTNDHNNNNNNHNNNDHNLNDEYYDYEQQANNHQQVKNENNIFSSIIGGGGFGGSGKSLSLKSTSTSTTSNIPSNMNLMAKATSSANIFHANKQSFLLLVAFMSLIIINFLNN